MVYLYLFLEFFKTGLFSVGGGLATLPFLYQIAERYDWLPIELIPDMIAVAESTPGPIGINMATYAGFNAAGVFGGILATLSLVLPSYIIIILISRFLEKFRDSKLVDAAFYGLRPAVAGLITVAGWEIFRIALFNADLFAGSGNLLDLFNFKAIILFALLFYLVKKFNKHPIVYIAGAAVVGIIFRF